MAIPIRVPEFDTNEETIKIGHWLMESGQLVQAGDHLVELLIPGIVYVVSADSEGVLGGTLKKQDQHVNSGDVIAWLESADLSSLDHLSEDNS
jgi:pyruvate/2-oxoglutarate dehydrogenase complex dihydrolipoamide acyltransferase (E2) component